MTAIGSAALPGAGGAQPSATRPPRPPVLTGEALETARAESEAFTKAHAHLGANDYIKASLERSQSRTSEKLASGEATETFKVRFDGNLYTLAGTRLDLSTLAVTSAPLATPAEATTPASANVSSGLAEHPPSPTAMTTSTAGEASSLSRGGPIRTLSREDWLFSVLTERQHRPG